MIIEFLPRTSIEAMRERLLAGYQLRCQHPYRFSFKELAFVYEPADCFYIGRAEKLDFVPDLRKFAAYIYERNVPLVIEGRGGSILWHGKGQIILEALIDLQKRKMNPDDYIACLENTLVATARDFGVNAIKAPCHGRARGAWVRAADGALKKIGFLGWHDSQGFALHGCALNVAPDVEPFSLIWPCGIVGAQATSIYEILGNAPPMREVAQRLAYNFEYFLREARDKIQQKKLGP